MTAQIVDLASYRAAKKRAERTQADRAMMDTLNALPGPRCVPRLPFIGPFVDESDGFSREELVDLRKLFMEE